MRASSTVRISPLIWQAAFTDSMQALQQEMAALHLRLSEQLDAIKSAGKQGVAFAH